MATNPYTGGSAALSAVPEEYQPKALENLQQQRMAQLLMQQAMTGQPQGQMISGHYVKPSWSQQLAPVANQALAMYANYQADKGQLDLAKAIREGDRAALADYMATKEGKPAVEGGIYSPAGELTKQTTADMYGADMALNPQYKQVAPVAAVPPNARGAYAKLLTDPRASAKLQDFAFAKMNEGPIKAGVDDTLLDPVTYQPLFKGAGKNPASIETAAIVLGLDRKPRDQWTAQDRAMIDNQIQKTAKSGAANLGQKDFSNSLSLRKEFNGEPVYKGHQEIKSAWNTINVGLKQANPAGDLAAATKFMKLLDPTSVVRESELLLAMKATGALDKLYNYAQMRANGTLLTPKQRSEFGALANEFYQTATDQYNAKYGEYADIAKRNNLNPLDIGKPEAGIHNSQWGEVKVVDGGKK